MAIWQIQLLGGLRATRGNSVITQFPSRPTAMLLARLALEPQRRHAREEIIDLLWPDVELDIGRNRLRQVLSTLRRLLEPPDVPPDSVLIADRQTIGLGTDAVACDVHDFERLLRQGTIAQALDCYRGDLLPGYLDEWVEDERTRLSALHARAVLRSSAAIDKVPAHQEPVRPNDLAPALPARSPGFRNLPSYPSAFFGREQDKRRVLDALAQHRLVTLAGLGGFGKTRLAVESGREAERFDSVAFVALGECNDAGQIADRIRSALRMDISQEDALTQLCALLGDEGVLLILDNFEQLVDDGAAVVLDLLQKLPRLHVLATSRRVLDVPGERVMTIEPLAIPRASMSASEAVTTPSLALFIDRARGARADFAMTEDNRAALIELCRALEGLPLAIEIAASRIRTYSPSEMCDALSARFDLLTRQGQRTARYGRHASLQAAIEWSWGLLTPSQQQFFAALSVFRGTWTAEAAGAVCEGTQVRDQLETLVSDSLLRTGPDDADVTRFSMLETLREFAQERLDADPHALRARHRRYFLGTARDEGAHSTVTVEREFANLKQALATAVEDGDPACALDLAVAMGSHWEAHGTLPDELRLIEHAVANCPQDETRLDSGLNLLAQLTMTAGDSGRARQHAEHALRAAGDDPVRRARALVTLAGVNWERDQRDDGITSSLDEALALATRGGAADVQADALRVKATVALKHGEEDADYTAANALFERAETLYRRLGDSRGAYRVLLRRSGCLSGLGRYEDARQVLAACQQYFERLDSATDQIAVANMTGYLESLQEHWPEAVMAGRRCVRLAWDRHAHLPLAMAFLNLPDPLVMLGEVETAAVLMPFAAQFWKRSVGPLSASDAATVRGVRKGAVKRLGAQRTAQLWVEGEALSLAKAVRLALGGNG